MEQSQTATPVKKKQTRSCKLTKEQTNEKLKYITHEIKRHIGQPALLIVKEGREMVPYFIELYAEGKHISGRYKCYSPEGDFRCYLYKTPSPKSIMTGEQILYYFDEV